LQRGDISVRANSADRPVFEPLEVRLLLAASVRRGVLRVTGTGEGDDISVSVTRTKIFVTMNGSSKTFSPAGISSPALKGVLAKTGLASHPARLPLSSSAGSGDDMSKRRTLPSAVRCQSSLRQPPPSMRASLMPAGLNVLRTAVHCDEDLGSSDGHGNVITLAGPGDAPAHRDARWQPRGAELRGARRPVGRRCWRELRCLPLQLHQALERRRKLPGVRQL